MPLDKATLKVQIKQAFNDAKKKEDGPDAAIDALAGGIADAVDAYVKQMQITYTAGLAAPNGAVTGVFGNTIS